MKNLADLNKNELVRFFKGMLNKKEYESRLSLTDNFTDDGIKCLTFQYTENNGEEDELKVRADIMWCGWELVAAFNYLDSKQAQDDIFDYMKRSWRDMLSNAIEDMELECEEFDALYESVENALVKYFEEIF